MRILQATTCADNTAQAKAVVELSRKEIGVINKLMFQAGMKDYTRAHFFLLYDLLSHKAFDSFSLTMGNNILTGKLKGGAEEE